MPFIQTISKKAVDKEAEAFRELEKRLSDLGEYIEDECIYSLDYRYTTLSGPAIVAFAELENNKYAIYAPEYLNGEQLVIFECIMRDFTSDLYYHLKDLSFIVFSERDYDQVKKYAEWISVELKK